MEGQVDADCLHDAQRHRYCAPQRVHSVNPHLSGLPSPGSRAGYRLGEIWVAHPSGSTELQIKSSDRIALHGRQRLNTCRGQQPQRRLRTPRMYAIGLLSAQGTLCSLVPSTRDDLMQSLYYRAVYLLQWDASRHFRASTKTQHTFEETLIVV